MLPVVSLFTGAGGLDLGMRAAGEGVFDFRAWVENDSDCRTTLIANNSHLKDNPNFYRDVEKVHPQTLMRSAKLQEGETFLLIGGPPCQAFSTAGLRRSVNADQGRVVHSYFDMVGHLRPRFFVFENVRGLLSAAIKHRPLTDRAHPKEVLPEDDESRLGSVMDRVILPAFAKLGYETVYGLLCAADYGTAQHRHRLFILGSREREFRSGVFRKQTSRRMEPHDLVPPTHHRYAPYPPIQPWRTLRDAIGHLPADPDLEDTYTYSPERAAVFHAIPEGKNWKWIRENPTKFPAGYLKEVMGGAMESGGGKEGFWRRLAWNQVTPTLTAQPQQLASSLCHPSKDRPLSIPEYAAVQDFPCDYVVCGSKSSRYRQIGNAVPLRLAEAVGRVILAVSRGAVRAADDSTSADDLGPAEPKYKQPRRGRRTVRARAVPERNLFSIPIDGEEW